MNKYRNKKIEVDGIVFDSKKEANRYRELKLLEDAGEIINLQRQVKFLLIPSQREPDKRGARGGIVKGNLLERECSYIADFVYAVPIYYEKQYTTTEGKTGKMEVVDDFELVVEDTKGFRTADYKIKRKLMLYVHGIKIKEL